MLLGQSCGILCVKKEPQIQSLTLPGYLRMHHWEIYNVLLVPSMNLKMYTGILGKLIWSFSPLLPLYIHWLWLAAKMASQHWTRYGCTIS